ncbi:MAG: FkbM family methyltransferase [Verrucomicrobia bacterium]|nr:FkbM family methyltransferase [Verrucomicrobiota bacterium]
MPESVSQFGEDVLVLEYFQQKRDCYFIEVGANDPVKFSQTWLLEQHGWRGALVEPLAAKCERLRAARPGSRVIQAAVAAPEDRGETTLTVTADDMFSTMDTRTKGSTKTAAETVRVVTLDDVLAELGSPAVDFISIDIEGLELPALRGFSLERVRPKLLLLEDHLKDLRLHRHVCARGYRLVKRTGCNSWYMPAGQPPPRTTAGERFALWQRIWLRTPLAVVRGKLRAIRKRRATP